ncbi:MAG: hypothetical protein ABW321_05750, partial [Polyangiales bacterium]
MSRLAAVERGRPGEFVLQRRPIYDALKQLAPIAGWLALLTLYYVFVATAGKFELLSWNTDYYDLLAESIRRGQLHLPVIPKPRLLAKSNPYDYKYARSWLWDASLYKGHYYLYWGPIPGVCLWLYKLIANVRETVHDQWLLLVFMLGRLYMGSALIVVYARTQGRKVASWALQLAILVFGLASPTPYFMARPLVYEVSIASGQMFLFSGLLASYVGLLRPLLRTRLFVLAGCCFACAFGSRGSLLVVAPLVVLVTALVTSRPAGYAPRKLLGALLALGVPVAAGLGAYLIYNKLRFDSFREFGLTYQLTSRPFETQNRWFWPNVVSYLSSDHSWSCRFPFVKLPRERALTPLIEWPDDYDIGNWDKGERTSGILAGMSICWLWLTWWWRAADSGMRVRARVLLDRGGSRSLAFSQRELWWLGVSTAMVCALLPASRMWMANMRFLQDAAGGIQ